MPKTKKAKVNAEDIIENDKTGDREVLADAQGNQFLEGMRPVVPKKIKELIDKGTHIKKVLNIEFAEASKRLTTAQTEFEELCHKHIEYFTEDEKGNMVYHLPEIDFKATIQKKEKIVIEVGGDED